MTSIRSIDQCPLSGLKCAYRIKRRLGTISEVFNRLLHNDNLLDIKKQSFKKLGFCHTLSSFIVYRGFDHEFISFQLCTRT